MLWELIKSLIDSLLLAVSDWLHPEAKELRKELEAEAKVQDEKIEDHAKQEKVLTETAKAQDEQIVADEAALNTVLTPLPKVERTQDEEFNLISRRIRK